MTREFVVEEGGGTNRPNEGRYDIVGEALSEFHFSQSSSQRTKMTALKKMKRNQDGREETTTL